MRMRNWVSAEREVEGKGELAIATLLCRQKGRSAAYKRRRNSKLRVG